jgi:hypothetical protein
MDIDVFGDDFGAGNLAAVGQNDIFRIQRTVRHAVAGGIIRRDLAGTAVGAPITRMSPSRDSVPV